MYGGLIFVSFRQNLCTPRALQSTMDKFYLIPWIWVVGLKFNCERSWGENNLSQQCMVPISVLWCRVVGSSICLWCFFTLTVFKLCISHYKNSKKWESFPSPESPEIKRSRWLLTIINKKLTSIIPQQPSHVWWLPNLLYPNLLSKTLQIDASMHAIQTEVSAT